MSLSPLEPGIPPSPNPSASFLDRAAAKEIVQADVLRSLGNDLFAIRVQGSQVTAVSSRPLQTGQTISLEVSRDVEGLSRFRVLPEVTSGGTPLGDAAVGGVAKAVSTRTLVENLSLSARLAEGRPSEANQPNRLSIPEGPLANLAARRPELASRIEALLRLSASRPEGLGRGIENLAGQVAKITTGENATPGFDAIQATAGRLIQQLVGPELLADPRQLASAFASRLPALAAGLEGVVAGTLESADWMNPELNPGARDAGESIAVPSSNAKTALNDFPTPNALAQRVLADTAKALASATDGIDPKPAVASNSADPVTVRTVETIDSRTPAVSIPNDRDTPTTEPLRFGPAHVDRGRAIGLDPSHPEAPNLIRGELEGDLKGQLLELRSKLILLASDPPSAASSASISRAIERTEMLLDQVTSQQVRNLDGLNRYLHVELPVDPKTGIDEARLQVFYRHRDGSSRDRDASDRFTVAVFLKLSSLGDVLATVTGIDRSIGVAMVASGDIASGHLNARTDELRTSLLKAGAEGASVTVRKSQSQRTEMPGPTDVGEDLWTEFQDNAPRRSDSGARLDLQT